MFSIIVSIISYELSVFYITGDQLHYQKVYSHLSDMPIIEAYSYYQANLSSYEPVHFIIVWIFSSFADKNLLMAFFNGVLALYASRIMLKLGGNPFVVLILLLFTYYPLVLYLAAERLKFSFILFFIAIYHLMNSRKGLAYTFAFLSVFAHVQILISISSLATVYFIGVLNKLISKQKIDNQSFLIIAVGLVAIIVMFKQVSAKYVYYNTGFNFADLAKFFVIFIFTLFYTKRNGFYSWKRISFATMLFLPLFIVTLFLGTDRTIFFGYFLFLYFAVQVNGGLNAGVLASIFYGFYKTNLFLSNLFIQGNGFG